MPRNLNQEIIDELAGFQMFPFTILDLTDGETNFKYSSTDVPITLSGYAEPVTASGTYMPVGFKLESIKQTVSNVQDKTTLNIEIDNTLKNALVGNVMRGQPASIHVGLIDSNNDVMGVVLLFDGEFDSFNMDESNVKITVGSIFTKWNQASFGKHSSSCRYKVFKGDRCTYSGTEVNCDRSKTRCTTLENTDNYGGFPWLQSIENKKIQWGPNQDESAWLQRH